MPTFTREEVEDIAAQLNAIQINGKSPFSIDPATIHSWGRYHRLEIGTYCGTAVAELRRDAAETDMPLLPEQC